MYQYFNIEKNFHMFKDLFRIVHYWFSAVFSFKDNNIIVLFLLNTYIFISKVQELANELPWTVYVEMVDADCPTESLPPFDKDCK